MNPLSLAYFSAAVPDLPMIVKPSVLTKGSNPFPYSSVFQPNASARILVTDSGIVTEKRLRQLKKALISMLSSPCGSITDVISLLFIKAVTAIYFVPSLTVTVLSEG